MGFNKKYKITVEDQSDLEKKIDFSARFPVFILILIGFIVLAGAFGVFILASTPMKTYLPGYMKADERTATEEQHLRIDSLNRVYEINEAYINSILNALNPGQEKIERAMSGKPTPLTLDSLKPASPEEIEFMEKIREREKFNIGYASSAAAQTMMFGSVNRSAVISEASKQNYKAEVILPNGAPVSSIADGKVISVASSPSASGGYEIIIQHPKGFLSKTGRLKNIMVHPGDKVVAGQIIASGIAKGGLKESRISFELWHDGDPLIPSLYLEGAF